MAKDDTSWVLDLEGETHTVRLEWGPASDRLRQTSPVLVTSGKIFVDEQMVREFSGGLAKRPPDELHFEVAGRPAVLQKTGGPILLGLELYVDGKLIP